MAEEIKVPVRLYPARNTSVGAYWDDLQMATNHFNPTGIILPNNLISRCNWELTEPIPTNINATHASILRVWWATGQSTGNFQCFYDEQVVTLDTTSLDFTVSLSNVIDAVNGQYVLNQFDIDYSALSGVTSGKHIHGVFERPNGGSDTINGDVLLYKAFWVANI